ncbi:hypothetical protein GCM10010924_39260 [Rhizobium wenxiniae]|uniref:Putative transposase n=1 Tax=Rhizobium wenxiniae TaxID=1737357 RepID=A0A7W9YA45_9HYPH|nr:putative transposase [Rhizobium wenxiniae]GGG06679.1 hypothetical protein GCM10010924_39260 [Rhizobium wenxiniae]
MRTANVCCKHGKSEATFYKYKVKFGAWRCQMNANQSLWETSIQRQKALLAETMLDNSVLKDVASKK